MGQSKKPRNKRYIPKWNVGGTKLRAQPLKVKLVFDPLEAIVDQLEQEGTIDVATDGTPVFKDAVDGTWYDSHVALMGVVEAYEIHERRHNRNLDMEPLRQLANKLKYSMPVSEADTRAVRLCLARMRAETLDMTAEYAAQLIRDFQIMEEMQKAAA